jgi:hypothetical protein
MAPTVNNASRPLARRTKPAARGGACLATTDRAGARLRPERVLDRDVGRLVERHRDRGTEHEPPHHDDLPAVCGRRERQQPAGRDQAAGRHDRPHPDAVGDAPDGDRRDAGRHDGATVGDRQQRAGEVGPGRIVGDEDREAVVERAVRHGDLDAQRDDQRRLFSMHPSGGAHRIRMMPPRDDWALARRRGDVRPSRRPVRFGRAARPPRSARHHAAAVRQNPAPRPREEKR